MRGWRGIFIDLGEVGCECVVSCFLLIKDV